MESCFTSQSTSMQTDKQADYRIQPSPFSNEASGLYSIQGILEYLQSEWAKMEMERSEWAVEKAELQAQIAFLQGECRGQENLKTDLVRRVKMLEFALVQERSKNFKLKYPNDNIPAHIPQFFDCDLNTKRISNPKLDIHGMKWREERARLKEYVINVGLGDVMDDLRNTRIQDIIASLTESGSQEAKTDSDHPTPISTSISESQQTGIAESKSAHSESSSVPANNFSEILPGLTNGELSACRFGDMMDVTDAETAEALAEFDLLVAQQDVDNPLTALGDGEFNHLSPLSTSHLSRRDWDNLDDAEMMAHFKEQYRSERFKSSRQTVHSSNYESFKDDIAPREQQLQHPMLSMSDIDTEFPTSQLDIDVKRPSSSIFRTKISPELDQLDGVPTLTGFQGSAVLSKTNVPASPSTITEADLGLGDLASLTVANEAAIDDRSNMAMFVDNDSGLTKASCLRSPAQSEGCTVNGDTSAVSQPSNESPGIWTAKYTLRSHFDSIRSALFHPREPYLLTASEDHSLKMWNLNKTVQVKKTTNFDVEPVYTFRGHDHPVLSLALWIDPSSPEDKRSSPMVIYSGDLNGQLRSWRVSKLNSDPYDPFEPHVIGPLLRGHTDAIWSMTVRTDGSLLSASTDGTVCLWSPPSTTLPSYATTILPSNVFQVTTSLMMASTFTRATSNLMLTAPVPTSVCLALHGDIAEQRQFFVGFTSGHVGLYDMETKNLIRSFSSTDISDNSAADLNSPTKSGSVTCVVKHPHHPLVMSAHEDRHIRFFDPLSGQCVHSMVAHLDAVTALTIDPQGNYLLSASHDCSIRLWNLHKKTCIQEITSHRKKFGEAIHTVAFHPTKRYMASGGADALAKVFV